jgi:hypothetical protein
MPFQSIQTYSTIIHLQPLSITGEDDLTEFSHETLETSAIPADEDHSKVQEQVVTSASLAEEATPAVQLNIDNEMEQASQEICESTCISSKESSPPEDAVASLGLLSADLMMPTADPLGVENAAVEGPASELDKPSTLEERPAPPVVTDDMATDMTDGKDAGSEHSDPSEPELLDLSDAKTTDTESEVEILVSPSFAKHCKSTCICFQTFREL